MEYGVRVEGVGDATLRMRAIDRFADEIKETLQTAGELAADYMKVHVPFYGGAMYRAIFAASTVDYRPGGAGGGGFYEMRVGLDETQAPHSEFVIEGTGIFGPRNAMIRGNDGPMRFEARGNIVFAESTIGQPPQTEWFEDAVEFATQYIESELFGLEIDF